MKNHPSRHLTKLCGLLLLVALTFSARAMIVLQDNFNYPNGYATNASLNVWTAAPGDSNLAIGVTNNTLYIPGNSLTDQSRTYFTAGITTNQVGAVINSPNKAFFFPSNSPVAALYYGFTFTEVGALPGSSTYFAFFTDTNFDYRARLYVGTNGATPGYFRFGIANGSSPNPATNIVQQDLTLNTGYNVVVRYVLATGVATVWVNPIAESDSSANETATETQATSVSLGGNTNTSTCGIGLRNAATMGAIAMNNLVAATTFGDVVPSSVGFNPPFVALQPLDDTSAIVGDNVTFSALFGGDTNMTYQWYYDGTTALTGQTNLTLTLTSVTTGQAGTYSCTAVNNAGNLATRAAQLAVYTAAVAPVVTNAPQNLTVNVGDTATFTVVAGGVPPPTYQWYYVTNSAGTLKTNLITGATTASYGILNVNTNISGNFYYVAITNRAGGLTTAKATLTVNPIQTISIATLRSMVDGSYNATNTTSVFTVQGTVTSWTNSTTAGNTEFYMQDSTAGISVFWSGAPSSTNYPGAGSIVRVTAPLSTFDGLLELEPVFTNTEHSVKVISTNNPLPVAQALPFDPNVTFAQLKALESCYCVASNVTLAAASVFGSGVNENIVNNNNLVLTDPIPGFTFTNAAGQIFDIYVNSYVGIAGLPQPTGPVTIYGILGIFNSQFEFTPTRYADIISYIHVTNYLSSIVRPGDALTNSYSEMALPPGETLTSVAYIGDAAGGTVTLSPQYAGLPASASFSNITNGLNATATFHFTPAPGDAGSNYVVNLVATSSSGTVFTNTVNVYVPTPDEQHIAITEFLANPTTNTSLPLFNPLGRSPDTTAITTSDQYIEISSQATNDYDLTTWDVDNGSAASPLDNFHVTGPMLYSSNSIVIYGGNGSGGPNLPVYSEPASSGGLSLPATGTGVVILRNGSGYIVDRVVFNASTLPTNCAMSRFPTLNSGFVPQSYISTNVATPGLQYDGSSWGLPTKVPAGITGLSLAVTNKQAVIKFPANTTQVNTLWQAGAVTGPFQVITGKTFSSSPGSFSVTNLPASSFFYMTTQ